MISKRSLILGAGATIITRRALAYPVRLNNPLAYPAGIRPGVNQSHLASANIAFSGVALGNTFLRLDQTVLGYTAGTIPTPSVDGNIGPVFTTTTQSFAYGPTRTTLTNGMTWHAVIHACSRRYLELMPIF